MPKQLLFGSDTLDKIKAGVTKIAQAVGVTMGPNGQNVIISRDNAISITKDGVSVAREVDLEDPLEAIGAQLIKQIAQKTAYEAGDGTTTSTILASAMFIAGHEHLIKGVSPTEIKMGMELQTKLILEGLKNKAIKIQDGDIETIKNIATISANNDLEIGHLIAKAYETIGFNGVIKVQESRTSETSIAITDGLQFDGGYVSPYFSTNEKSIVELKNPMIFIYDGKINRFHDIFLFLEQASLKKVPIVFICDGIDIEALNAVLVNCTRAQLQACIIKSPAYGEHRFNMLNDIATVIGATVISPKDNIELRDIKGEDNIMAYMGTCDTIEVNSQSTSIIGGRGLEENITARVEDLREAAEEESNPSSKLMLTERAAKISNGVALLLVGANSELELKEKLERIDDALSATKAALAEGYISGGGSVLYDLSNIIAENYDSCLPGIRVGMQIVSRACVAPFKLIVENSDKKFTDIVSRLVDGMGYNAKTDTVENLIKAGVIDPVKVTRCSLENSLSVASLMLNTGCMMVQIVEAPLLYNPKI